VKISQLKGNPELRSGLMVVCSAVILLALLFSAGKVDLFSGTSQVPLFFDYISGLEKNAPVYFAGHKVGKVSDIQFAKGADARIQVTASIASGVQLKTDSEAYIDVLGFMLEKMVELTPGSPEAAVLPKGTPIRGSDPIAMMEIIKRGTELMDEFEATNESMKKLVADLEGLVSENRGDFDQIVSNLNDTSVNLKEMTSDLKKHPWKLLRKSDDKKKHFLFF